jgi:hypothetical protein
MDRLTAAATNDPTPTKSVTLWVSTAALNRYPIRLQPYKHKFINIYICIHIYV